MASPTLVRLSALATALCLVSLTACDAEEGAAPEALSSAPVAADTAPALDQVELGRFVGAYNAATGAFTLESFAPRIPDGADLGALRSVEQASWCPARVVSDGTIGTNPVDSFEIYSATGSSSFDIGDCTVRTLAAFGDPADFPISGVFCTDVIVKSYFDTETLSDVFAEITLWDGATTELPWRFPLGTGAQPPVNATAEGVDGTIGLWGYQTLAPGQQRMVPWTFKFGGNDFRFEGRLVANVAEDCGNGVDDDCDGDIDGDDTACGLLPAGAACTADTQCTTQNCTASVCAADCRDGVFGTGCTALCPGGLGSSQCSSRGTCDDGLAGDGSCTCEPGYTGSTCSSGCAPGYFEYPALSGICETCASSCGANGTCALGGGGPACSCDIGFAGATCNGCAPGRWGVTCAECDGGAVNPCSGNGVCSEGIAGTGLCACDSGWSGTDCSTAAGPAMPTGVSATDGTRADGTEVTWTASAGATFYRVYRAGLLVGDNVTGTSYLDTSVLGTIDTSAATIAATDATSVTHVALSISGVTSAPGAVAAYVVAACDASTCSSTSASNNGNAGAPSLVDVSVQWQRTGVDSASSAYINIDGAIAPAWEDALAPADGRGRYYRALVGSVDGSTATAVGPDRGVRARQLTATGGWSVTYAHTCRITPTGGVECWGSNNDGQLGIGSTTNAVVPTPVTGLSTGVVSIAAGAKHTCAVMADGTVRCWGDNNTAQIGDGSVSTDRLTPVAVSGLTDVVQVSAGDSHTCAVKADGSAWCWGLNSSGRLGDGGTTQQATPVRVVGIGGVGFLADVAQIAAGDQHTCARTHSGAAWCWGNNGSGKLGNGTATTPQVTPTAVSGLTDATSITTGADHSCASRATGAAVCWGGNSATYRQLGAGTGITTSNVPVTVSGLSGGVVSVASSPQANHTCALRADGGVSCWGWNQGGQLGDTNAAVQRALSVGVGGLAADAVSLSVGNEHGCAVLANGDIQCWGRSQAGIAQLGYYPGGNLVPDRVGTLGDVIAVSEGYRTGCALIKTGETGGNPNVEYGEPWCWGRNDSGAAGGTASTSDVAIPRRAHAAAYQMVNISSGSGHSCGVTVGGNVYCWGDGAGGILGNGSTTSSSVPVQVLGVGGIGFLSNIRQVSAGTGFTCAVATTGEVYCWGQGSLGALGNGATANQSTPVQVLGVGGVGTLVATAVESSTYLSRFACAITDNSDVGSEADNVVCWGQGGALGLGTNGTSPTPVNVIGLGGVGLLSGVTQLDVGQSGACVRLASSNVACWGSPVGEVLGRWNVSSDCTQGAVVIDTPVLIRANGVGNAGYLTGVEEVVLAGYVACARMDNGVDLDSDADNLMCWGDFSNSVSGIIAGPTTDSACAVEVVGADDVAGVEGGDYSLVYATLGRQLYSLGNTSEFGLGRFTDGSRVAPTVSRIPGPGNSVLVSGEAVSLGYEGLTVVLSDNTLRTFTGVNNFYANVTHISSSDASESHSCVRKSDGTVWCWGLNASGQLGNSTIIDSRAPVRAGLGTDYTMVAVGTSHSCGLRSGGTAQCWGAGSSCQMGNGGCSGSTGPVNVTSTNASSLSVIRAGGAHTCAIRSTDGTVWCWGAGGGGALGYGSTSNQNVPVQATGVSGATSLAAGLNHSCAANSTSAWCWGTRGVGRIGDGGTTTGTATTPVTVSGLTGVEQMSAGNQHTCAVVTGGAVYCWGLNSSGQLGDGTSTDRNVPTLVPGLTAQFVYADRNSTCALTTGGSLVCWGADGEGQVSGERYTTRGISNITSGVASRTVQVAIASNSTCALDSWGFVRCWGYNGGGQLGRNDTITPPEANYEYLRTVLPRGTVTSIVGADAGNTFCALLSSGAARCWGGDGFDTSIGDNEEVGTASALGTTGAGRTIIAIDAQPNATGSQFCTILDDGSVDCGGFAVAVPVGGVADISMTVDTNMIESIAIDANGALRAFGAAGALDQNGALATGGAAVPSSAATAPAIGATAGISGYFDVANAALASIAIDRRGRVQTWGRNTQGTLGTGSGTATTIGDDEAVPAFSVFPLATALVRDVELSATTACAALADGTLRCWGANQFGQLGLGNTATLGDDETPLAASVVGVGAGRTVRDVVTGSTHTCAILDDWTVRCWGRNSNRELGNGSTSHLGDNEALTSSPALSLY